MGKLVNEIREETKSYGYDSYVEDVFLKEPEGCVPNEYIGDDLMAAILEKFGLIYRTLAEVFDRELKKPKKDKFEFVKTCIEPSYEGETYYVIHYKGKVLLEGGIKAWHLWWESEEEMEKELENNLKQMRKSYEK